jgi:hypothetical protein
MGDPTRFRFLTLTFEREIHRVTPAGLQSQSLSRILECEKPEIEKQRNDILKLQGEQNVKLRSLEEKMLREISAVEGSILDDDRVVEGMERLMKEGAQVEEQIANSAKVMSEVQGAIVSIRGCHDRTVIRLLTRYIFGCSIGCI